MLQVDRVKILSRPFWLTSSCRTGLDIATSGSAEQVEGSILEAWERYKEKGDLRFEHKALNDHLVRIVLRIAGECKKPGKFIFTVC